MLSRRAFGVAAAATLVLPHSLRADQLSRDLSALTPEQRDQFRASHARMMAAFDYERLRVSGSNALAEWERRSALADRIPVVVGDAEQLERLAEQFTIDDETVSASGNHRPPPVPAILAAASKLRFPGDLGKWPGAYAATDLTAPLGEWPKAVAEADLPGLTVANDPATGKPLSEAYLLMLPARASWEIPAYLRWGNWNACPPAEYHVAALKRWHERFGAELVGIGADMMNVRVKRRPSTRDEALALADEQYRYCPDIIDQGVGSRSALATLLMASDWWFFWWD
ncbi:MAG TPA: DUF4253 domain-containing protein [Sphingomonas sp.]|nr:DUF4253 domain-containing protein [Sphingomonas sp.]